MQIFQKTFFEDFFGYDTVCAVLVGTTDLLEHLFKSYDRRVRPYADNKTAVYVHMTIVLGIMIEMVRL